MTGIEAAEAPGDDLLSRGARGALALGLRQLVVQLISFAAAIVLARILSAAEFGVYGITVFLMQFLVVFGDAGLAAGLVREREEPDERDWRAVFTFQQMLVAGVAVAALLLAPWLRPLFGAGLAHLPEATLAALLLSSLQTVPAARLERELAFDRLARVEVVQAVAFHGVAVALALAGFGADAMAAALVARAGAGAAGVQLVSRWPLGWAADWQRVRRRLHFGLSYQGAALVNLVRDALVPVFVGWTLGSAAVGGIFFASMLAFHPFVIVYMLQRLLLPVFGRLQARPAELARAVELSIFAVAVLVVPVQTTVLALEQPVVRLVFGEQWLASLDVFRWLWIAALLEPQLVVAIALLNALGRADRTLRFLVVTTLALWLLGVPLLLLFGAEGYGIASALMLGTKAVLLREADSASRVRSLSVVRPVWIAAAASGAAIRIFAGIRPAQSLPGLSLQVLLALGLFAVALAVVAPGRCSSALRQARARLSAPSPRVAGGDATRGAV